MPWLAAVSKDKATLCSSRNFEWIIKPFRCNYKDYESNIINTATSTRKPAERNSPASNSRVINCKQLVCMSETDGQMWRYYVRYGNDSFFAPRTSSCTKSLYKPNNAGRSGLTVFLGRKGTKSRNSAGGAEQHKRKGHRQGFSETWRRKVSSAAKLIRSSIKWWIQFRAVFVTQC
jgi:hypothetical protein